MVGAVVAGLPDQSVLAVPPPLRPAATGRCVCVLTRSSASVRAQRCAAAATGSCAACSLRVLTATGRVGARPCTSGGMRAGGRCRFTDFQVSSYHDICTRELQSKGNVTVAGPAVDALGRGGAGARATARVAEAGPGSGSCASTRMMGRIPRARTAEQGPGPRLRVLHARIPLAALLAAAPGPGPGAGSFPLPVCTESVLGQYHVRVLRQCHVRPTVRADHLRPICSDWLWLSGCGMRVGRVS